MSVEELIYECYKSLFSINKPFLANRREVFLSRSPRIFMEQDWTTSSKSLWGVSLQNEDLIITSFGHHRTTSLPRPAAKWISDILIALHLVMKNNRPLKKNMGRKIITLKIPRVELMKVLCRLDESVNGELFTKMKLKIIARREGETQNWHKVAQDLLWNTFSKDSSSLARSPKTRSEKILHRANAHTPRCARS